jgi:hypothetical protein
MAGRMGGRLDVESSPGHTAFTLTLPLGGRHIAGPARTLTESVGTAGGGRS